MTNNDSPSAREIRETVNNLHGAPKGVRHCAYRVWLNVFRKQDKDEADDSWRNGLSHYCIDNFSLSFLHDHGKRLP